jgi:heme O synthase-like polyprenyltransferase
MTEHANEPPAPQRGLTREERGRDVSEAQADAEAQTSKWKRFLALMSPRLVWSMAEGYPVVVKQFLQFCLILIYPAWVFAVLVGGLFQLAFYVTVYPLLWLLFWPVRAYQKKNNPEEYAANRAKYEGKKWYET